MLTFGDPSSYFSSKQSTNSSIKIFKTYWRNEGIKNLKLPSKLSYASSYSTTFRHFCSVITPFTMCNNFPWSTITETFNSSIWITFFTPGDFCYIVFSHKILSGSSYPSSFRTFWWGFASAVAPIRNNNIQNVKKNKSLKKTFSRCYGGENSTKYDFSKKIFQLDVIFRISWTKTIRAKSWRCFLALMQIDFRSMLGTAVLIFLSMSLSYFSSFFPHISCNSTKVSSDYFIPGGQLQKLDLFFFCTKISSTKTCLLVASFPKNLMFRRFNNI